VHKVQGHFQRRGGGFGGIPLFENQYGHDLKRYPKKLDPPQKKRRKFTFAKISIVTGTPLPIPPPLNKVPSHDLFARNSLIKSCMTRTVKSHSNLTRHPSLLTIAALYVRGHSDIT